MAANGRNKTLVLLVIVLLVTNAGMLIYFLKALDKERNKTHSERTIERVHKEMKFDDAQLEQYIALRHKRDSFMRPMYVEVRAARMKMVDLLRQPTASDSVVAAVAAEIVAKTQPIEVEYYKHFRRVEAICRPDQLSLFDSLLVNIVKRKTRAEESVKN